MKKITLFVCALAVSAAAIAAPFKKAVKSNTLPTIKQVEATLEGNGAQKQLKEGVIDTIIVPYRTYQPSYRIGKPSEGLTYDYYAQGITSEYRTSVFFINDSMYNADWYFSDTLYATNRPYISVPVHFGENELPLMKIAKTDSTFFWDWQISKNYVEIYWEGYDDFYSTYSVAPAEFTPITRCARYTEDPKKGEGNDMYQVGAGSYGSYCYGTQLSNPWVSGLTMDSMIVLFDNSDVITIDHITAGIYTKASSGAGMFPGENDHVRLSIYKWGATINYDEPIAEATANFDNVTLSTDQNGNALTYGLIEWDFLVPDPVTGAMVPAPITIEGDFFVLIDEYNEGTANFGFFSDYYADGVDCRTYFPWFDPEDNVHRNSSVWGNNILLNIVAYFPVFEAPEEVEFAADETEKVLTIVSNVWDEDAIVDEENLPDWITVAIASDTEVDSESGYDIHLYTNQLTITLAALPEGTAYREGTISIDAFGKPVEILVKQGENGGEAIDNVDFKHDGKSYNVLGIEVNDDYKGVIIRNGEKFIR